MIPTHTTLADPMPCDRVFAISLIVTIFIALAFPLAPEARAANKTWNNTGTDFNAAGSWTGGVPGIGDVALFSGPKVTNPNLNASLTIQELNFFTTATSGYDLTSSNTSIKLTLTNTGTGATSAINAANTSGTNTIDAPLVLGAAASSTQTFTQASGGMLVITGAISSANAINQLALAGSGGRYTFSGPNTYSGNTVVNSGVTLNINGATAISAGALVAGGNFTIDNTSGAALTLSNNNAINLSSGSLTFTGTNDLSFGSGAVTMTGANRTLTVSNSSATLTVGNIGDSGQGRSLNKDGAGTLVITGSSSYSGDTDILAGTLSVSALANTGSGSTISLDSASSILRYTGTGETTTKVVTLTGSAGVRTIDQSGASGTLIITSDLSSSSNGAKTLTLQGSTAGIGEFRGKIADKSGGQHTGVAKSGTGTWILSGDNTYSDGTTVSGGRLLVNGNQSSASGAVTVSNSGTVLGGTGTIGGKVTVGLNSIILGGSGSSTTGTLTVSNTSSGAITFQSGSIIELALGGSGTHSTLAHTGSGTISFDSSQAFTFINLGAQTGFYDNVITGTGLSSLSTAAWHITNGFTGTFALDGSGNIDLTLTAVPEPSTCLAGILTLAAIGFMQRRWLAKILGSGS